MGFRTELRYLLRYGASGVANTLLTTALMALLSLTPLPYPAWSAIAYLAGGCQSFLLNRHFTFRTRGHRVHRQIRRFVVVNLLCLALAQLIQIMEKEVGGFPLWLSVASGFAGYIGLGYVLNRLWVFRPHAGEAGPAMPADPQDTPGQGGTP